MYLIFRVLINYTKFLLNLKKKWFHKFFSVSVIFLFKKGHEEQPCKSLRDRSTFEKFFLEYSQSHNCFCLN